MFHRPVVAHRFFFALRPPPLLARQIAGAAHWFRAGGAVAADRLHVTLFIVDDLPRYSEALAALLSEAWRRRRCRSRSTVPWAVPARSRCGRAARCLRWTDLHRALTASAATAGVAERDGYRFSPHLTLGSRDGAPFSAPVAPVTWTAG